MDELRVILLLIGAAILAAIYFFSDSGKRRQARNSDRRQSGDPASGRAAPSLDGSPEADPPPETVSRELKRLGEIISRERKPGRAGRESAPSRPAAEKTDAPADRGAGRPAERAAEPSPKPEPDPDRIVVLYVRTRAGGEIAGPRLVEAARMAGLEYGHMDIYHRLDESGYRDIIFSMANMVAPGTLGEANTPEFTTPGVALFMQLPGPLRALDAWDAMLATARRLAEVLDAEMLDENHSTLNRQRIQQIREEMREYDRLSTLEIRKK